jgi:quercetin dioxygenase-like cupin family protein
MPVVVLALYTDRLEAKAALPGPLAGANRVIYVREGAATIRAGGQAATLAANSAWHGAVGCEVTAGAGGATLLRWELAAVAGAGAKPTLAQTIELAGPGGYLMRCDRVDFPPGGIAYTHTHRGPGIRCLLDGELRVEVNGRAHAVKPGEAWFEAGPDPVLAHAAEREPTSFARVMILPRELKGKSSIRYVRPEDEAQPKTQRYQVFCDEFITL